MCSFFFFFSFLFILLLFFKLLTVFTDSDQPYTRLHPAQVGFRKGYSTLTQAAICHHALWTKAVPYGIFHYFNAAYDATSVHHVMRSLQRRSLPAQLLYLIHSLTFQNGILLRWIRRDQGLPQGSPLSPIILDMFIDSPIHELNSGAKSILPRSLFLADDELPLPPSLAVAQQQLMIADDPAKQNGTKYNVLKCAVICAAKSPNVGENGLMLDG